MPQDQEAGMDQNPNDVIGRKLVPFIQDAYALEHQIVSTLEAHAEEARDFPAVQAKILEHLEQTKQHRDRMAARLDAYGQRPSAVKDALSGVLGNMLGAVSAMRPDPLARNARDEYVTEHLDIAGYTLLITTARALGDAATVEAAELNLRDEIAMQAWLLQHLPEVCIEALQEEGVNLPPGAWEATQPPSTGPGAPPAAR
jgi:ferritin-like metal-binding protein YciE